MVKFSTIPNRDSKPSDFWYAVKVEPQLWRCKKTNYFQTQDIKSRRKKAWGNGKLLSPSWSEKGSGNKLVEVWVEEGY